MKTFKEVRKNQQKQVIKRIVVKGKDILPYLYGNSKNIFVSKEYLSSEDLRQIVDGVRNLPCNFKRFGVQLIPVEKKFDIGRCYLVLDCYDGSISKRIVKVSNKEESDLGKKISYKVIWPERYKEAKGFFTVMEGNRFEECAYLMFNGPLPKENTNKKQSFREHVSEFAEDMKLLIELWSYSHFREELKNSISFDVPLVLWLENFPKQNGYSYQHEKVWEILERILWEGNLYGIQNIYTKNNPRYAFNFYQVDLITPIMDKLQTDILGKIIQDEDLFKKIFFGFQGEYMQRRLKVLLEMYYGPRELETTKAEERDCRSDNISGNGKNRKLALIIELIKRGATEGEKASARRAYEKVAGVPYM